jgi:hypothetical protein
MDSQLVQPMLLTVVKQCISVMQDLLSQPMSLSKKYRVLQMDDGKDYRHVWVSEQISTLCIQRDFLISLFKNV